MARIWRVGGGTDGDGESVGGWWVVSLCSVGGFACGSFALRDEWSMVFVCVLISD